MTGGKKVNDPRRYVPLVSGRGRIQDYLDDRLQAIHLCFDHGQPEACLALVYSAIDTFVFLGAKEQDKKATRRSFLDWANTYLVGRLTDIFDLNPVTAMDLYAARCGILHTSTSESDLGNKGQALEVFYRYREHQAIRLPALVVPFIALEVEALCAAFEEGAQLFIGDLKGDARRAQLAKSRAEGFMRWGVPISDGEVNE
jgi:hypothetical protein